ncbi:uncharacterized protein CTHT_0022680 [Thermochaetoides thermophila DSM 1495]|uniref:N-acetylglucosamine-induced protein 1 n=1 Tax=Chaetomium thermophilum (strain DSM 1495 / CBS 144.50 / IMI 039719) TaxID=759272 RepID=G0S4G0_CHATD|nr:hypothetical protein CTHT_0022680 [Thermochaetoides thermophila DSM 1495]EGS20438.1 hypothetical protein CTHT_0022680 [Thermochaetoides thermophila DSM 1495]
MGRDANAELPFNLTETDRLVLSQTDEDFEAHDWENLQKLIGANKLELLKRKPSDLRRYIQWSASVRVEYGSVANYVLVNRLPKSWGQPPFTPASSTPFADPSDYRVLINEWPYGLAPGITHLVVWSRTLIPTDDGIGDLTPESRKLVADFVKRYFVERLGPGGEDRVLWFKNWVSLQSVRSVDHVHVLVRDVGPEIIEEWTKEQDYHKERSI